MHEFSGRILGLVAQKLLLLNSVVVPEVISMMMTNFWKTSVLLFLSRSSMFGFVVNDN